MSKRKLLMTASVWAHIRNFHLPYLSAFQQLGWETHVACAGMPADAPGVDVGIDVPFEKNMFSPANFRAARLLRRRIRTEDYDLIITHTTLAAFFTRLALKGLPHRPKLVNVMHGYLFDDATPPIKRTVLLAAERLTAPQTDLLLVMNEWDLLTARKYRLGRRIEKIPGMGVDFERLDGVTESRAALRERLGLPGDAFVLIYAAEFSERKSQHVLIDAMARLPENVILLLPGDGALLEKCRAQAQRLDLGSRVRFPGQVSDMAPLYRAADVCASASRSEGLPFNIMEAMHCGLPVVASRVKGHVDLIEDVVSGLLYEYGDAAECAAQIRRLMEDVQFRQAVSTAVKARAAAYRLDIVQPDVMAKYLSLPEENNRMQP